MGKIIRKSTPLLLPVIIWSIMILYHGVFFKPFSDFMTSVSAPIPLSLILHTLIQLLILCIITTAAVKKLGYRVRSLIISIPVMYLLFAVYSPQSLYFFAFTGGYQIAFGEPQPAMASPIAAIFIVLQYGFVVIVTAFITAERNNM